MCDYWCVESVLVPEQRKEMAFYYPGEIWVDSDWIKNLILFFDGIALLVPGYKIDDLEEREPWLVTGLKEHGLLHIIDPKVRSLGRVAK